MNMTVKDVALLLNVSEKTIYRMIQNETIPCFKVGGQWRFDRREIMSWLEDTRTFSCKTAMDGPSVEDEESISLSEFLKRGGIYYNVPGDTKKEAIRASLHSMEAAIPSFDREKLLSSILQREALCSTAIGQGMALPHPKSFGRFSEFSYLSLCHLASPVPFDALDNENVDTLFFIFPKSERRFLRIQSKLLRLLRDGEVIATIKSVAPMEEIYRVFSRKEADLFKVMDT